MGVRHEKVLTPEEREQHLATLRDSSSDSERQHARERLIVTNLRLVEREVSRYRNRPDLDLDDLRQAGVIGLIHAVDKAPVAFLAYATKKIRFAIADHVTATQAAGVTGATDRVRAAGKAAKAVTDLTDVGMSRNAAIAAVARGRGVTPAVIAAELTLVEQALSTDVEAVDWSVGTAPAADHAVLAAEEQRERTETAATVQAVTATLPERERAVLMLRHHPDRAVSNVKAVAAAVGVTEGAAVRLERSGMARLRHPTRAHLLLEA